IRRTHRDPGCFQISAWRFSTHTSGLLNAPKRPAEPSQCDDLLFLFFVQDIAHAGGAYPAASMSRTSLSLAGFQLIIIGRFWVTAEAIVCFAGRVELNRTPRESRTEHVRVSAPRSVSSNNRTDAARIFHKRGPT